MKRKLLLSVLAFTLLSSCAQPAATPTPTEVVPEPTATVEPTREPTPTPTAEPEPTPHDDITRGIYPGEVWQEATTPEQLGWSSEKLAKAQEYSERIGSAAVMIVDDGVVVDAWGDITRNYLCHSMRKSLLSALYGIYVAEGEIDTTKTLDELGIDDHTPLTEAEKQANVADLLRARSGVYIPAAGEAASMKAMRPERGSHAPGTFWYYNNWDFNALGTIFDQETGEENIYQAFKTRIADPIGMQDFPIEDLQYYYEPYSMHPYYGFRMSARDLARFALLFLREGRWQDQQIIPADWVRESTATYSETGPDSGYGYMWWTGVKDGLFPNVEVKGHSYYASGWGGHEAIVLPYRKLVIVHRVNTDEPGQSVDTTQIGTLLWLILDAAGETETGESPFIESAQGVRLTADNLKETLAGSTARSASGSGEIVVSFSEDGIVTVSVAGALIDTGKWWTEGDKLCTEFTNPDLEDGCNLVMLDGTTMKLFDLDGTLEMKLEYSPGPAQSFEQEVERLREELNIPGLSVAVLQGQEVVFARGFGYADVENQIPATENTPYYIASCTKPFAAAVLMKLVEAGQLDLDAAMADILNDTTFPFPSGAIHGYAGLCETIIELSKDTSGPYAAYRSLFENYRCDTERITVRHHLTHTSQGVPGEAYRYNGFLYGLLSRVAEAASEQSFADLLIEYVTDPLEMTSTIPNSSDSHRQQILAELAKPYRIDDAGNVVPADFTQDLNAGAGMVSTVLDLAKFDVAMDRNLIVSKESKEAMFTPTLSNNGQPLPYGMGWFVQEHERVQLIWHYGQQTTYSSLILKVPEEELTLILLANSDGASAPFNLGVGDVLKSPFAVTFLNLFI